MADVLALLVPIIALLIPIYLIKRRYDLREGEKRAELASPDLQNELEEMRAERKLLQSRLENLESIVCSVDYELNQRLTKLLTSAEGAALEAPAPSPGADDGRAPAEVGARAGGGRAPERDHDGREAVAVSSSGSLEAASRAGPPADGAAPGAGASPTDGAPPRAAEPAPASTAESARPQPGGAATLTAERASAEAGGAGGDDLEVARAPTASAGADPRPSREAPRASAAEAHLFQRGQLIDDRYRVERLIGRGGMGAVYLAHDEVLGDVVALKLISSTWSHDPEAAIARFRREASAARRISSPNVIRIHDLGQTREGLLFISMEYMAPRTLDDLLRARGLLGYDEAKDILAQVCDGLDAAHRVGVVHRDLKPQNILVGERNAVKIIDFGVAKTTFLGDMTATGLILGTPQYMSPEQVKGRPIDARSDIYALGALAYHTFTGGPPFEGNTPIAVGFAVCTEEPADPRARREDLPESAARAIAAALAKEPTNRPQTVAAFRDAL